MPSINEAIRINKVLIKTPVLKDEPRIVSTLELNIEALKRLKEIRWYPSGIRPYELPGETKE